MPQPLHPLRIANFRAYWLSRFAGTLGISAQAIVLGWQVYGIARQTMDIRHSAFLLGMMGAAQFVPLFLLTPVVGLVADSVDRRWIVRGTTALLTIVAATLGILTRMDLLGLPALFGAAVFVGVARAFSGPAYSALAPNLVPRESLPTAIAISSIAWQVGTIAGPSIGGLLYAIHPDLAYATISILLAAALATMFAIGPVPQPPAQTDRKPLARILDGFSYVRRNRLVLATITLDLFAVLLAGATSLLPIYARDILHVGASGLGILAAGMGIGAATSAIWFSFRPMTQRCRREDAGRGHRLRQRDPDVRAVDVVPAIASRADRGGRCGHGVGLCPHLADPAPHPRCDARPGQRGVAVDHLRLERTGRGGKRADGVAARSGRRGGVRRGQRDRDHHRLGAAFPRIAPCTHVRPARHARPFDCPHDR